MYSEKKFKTQELSACYVFNLLDLIIFFVSGIMLVNTFPNLPQLILSKNGVIPRVSLN